MSDTVLGVDVGGTFTDLVLSGPDGVRIAKVATTPADQAAGVLDGVGRLAVDLGDLDRFTHGTTVATNAVLERRGADLVLVTTEGFRDLLGIARQDRPDLYDLHTQRPAPLVRRERVVEAPERLAADGRTLQALADPEAVAARVRALEPSAVAVCLLFSFLDDRHERAITDALLAGDPGLTVSRSSAVLPVFREYERASTTALNAYVAPLLHRYLDSLATRLTAGGLTTAVEVMRSGGGTFTADVAARAAVHTLLSGPAAGAWGAAAVGRAAGHDDVIAFDMGGTSTDVTLVADGRPRTTAEGTLDGLPFAVTTTDIHTVGAGGGSVAWRDAGGALRVGPRSAGADPGPAAYGRGGTGPTVTDANLVLGRLAAETWLGGHLPLRADRARQAVADLGAGLGLDPVACAAGILRVVEAQMTKALRVMSVERGEDPRRLALLPFGGAGPLHQAALARELGVGRVVVPPHPGVLSALGLLAAPLTTEQVRTHLVAADTVSAGELAGPWGELEDAARRLLRDQGAGTARVTRTADVRYRGQAFELEIPAGSGEPAELVRAFHDAHETRYGYAQRDEAVEIVNLRVRAEGPTPELPLAEVPAGRGADAARRGARPVVVDGETRECPVYDRGALGQGDVVTGPAVIAGVDSTVHLAGGQRGDVDHLGNLVVDER